MKGKNLHLVYIATNSFAVKITNTNFTTISELHDDTASTMILHQLYVIRLSCSVPFLNYGKKFLPGLLINASTHATLHQGLQLLQGVLLQCKEQ